MSTATGSGITRRKAIGVAAGVAGCLALGGATKALAGEVTPLRPPGAQDEDRFLAACIKCNRCVEVCPQRCLRTAVLEDGLLNWRTPVASFRDGACDFCGRCEDACPTTAIRGINASESCIGVAVVDQERCIAFQGSGCRVCVEQCPLGAISLSPTGRPVVDAVLCNGCGICELKCPSNSFLSYSGGSSRGINVCRKEA